MQPAGLLHLMGFARESGLLHNPGPATAISVLGPPPLVPPTKSSHIQIWPGAEGEFDTPKLGNAGAQISLQQVTSVKTLRVTFFLVQLDSLKSSFKYTLLSLSHQLHLNTELFDQNAVSKINIDSFMALFSLDPTSKNGWNKPFSPAKQSILKISSVQLN